MQMDLSGCINDILKIKKTFRGEIPLYLKMKMKMKTEFKIITREEYEELKKEILSLFKFVSVRRNKQNYAMGGFNITPKDYKDGLSNEQIDKISEYLKNLKIDNESLDILKNKVYGDDEGEFAGTPINYLIFKEGFHFLMKIKEGAK